MTERKKPKMAWSGETEAGFTCPICAKEFKGLAAFYRHLKTAHQAGQGERTKFNNQKVELDGYVFASGKEAQRYQELMLLQRAGEIERLQVHPSWDIYVSGSHICQYTPDFAYIEKGHHIVEDVKGGKATRTPSYMLKKRLMWACHGIQVKET